MAYALALNIDVKKKTIPQICKLIKEQAPDPFEFNRIMAAQKGQAPIVTGAEIHRIESKKTDGKSSSISMLLASPLYNRSRFFEIIKKLATARKDALCAFDDASGFTIVKRIGSKSVNGEAYLANTEYRGKSMYISVKMMPSNTANSNELMYHELFNSYVLTHKNPHFPLMYFDNRCSKCKYTGAQLQDLYEDDKCLVALNELANGDMKMWLKQAHGNGEFASMWAQIVIAGFVLEKEGLIHDDLHWGNVLFHEVPSYSGKYTYYTIGTKRVYIKNLGQHWVLWDFGLVSKKNLYDSSIQIDLGRISKIADWVMYEPGYKPLPDAQALLCDQIRACTAFTETYTMMLLHLEYFMKYLDPTVLLIDPVVPPDSSKLINTTPYVVL
jgi:hypothetical protein